MGLVKGLKDEVKSFGKEFGRQIFGKMPWSDKPKPTRRKTGAEKQYEQAQRWARRRGFK